MDSAKLKELFSDKAYVESIVKMSAVDAAKSLREKGAEVTAEDLMKMHDFILEHKEQLQNGELTEESLAEVAGGIMSNTEMGIMLGGTALATIGGMLLMAFSW